MTEQRRLSAIMFTDMVGYSKKVAEDEALALRLVDEHNKLVTSFVEKHEGHVLRFVGDAVMAEFASAISGIECALGIQRSLRERNEGRPEKEKILIRIGLHLGDILLRDGDLFGHGVNIAARLEPLAEPGGICVSRVVYDMVKRALKLNAVSLGLKELKNVGEPVEVFKVLLDEVDEARHAEAEITRHDDPRMRIVVAPFWGSTPQETDEGKKMAALAVRSLEKELKGEDVKVIFEDAAQVRTQDEALALGAAKKADSVVWGEVVELYGEVEIQPRLTWSQHKHLAALQVGALATHTSEKGQIAIRRAKADEVANAALYMAALHHRALGNLDKAISLFRAFIAGAGPEPSPWVQESLASSYGRIGWCFWLQHRIREAVQVISEGVKRFPLDGGLHAHLGACLMRGGQAEDGMREFQEALRLNPGDPVTKARMAFGHLQMDEVERALALAEEAKEFVPGNAYVRYHLGSCYMAAGRMEDAIIEYKEAARLEPENHEHRRFLGVAYLACNVVKSLREDPFRKKDFYFKEAERSFFEACRLAPLDRYNRLMHVLSRWFQGVDVFGSAMMEIPAEAVPRAPGWPMPIFEFYAGRMGEEDLLRAAGAVPDEATRRSCLTEAHFYAALARYQAEDAAGALEHFRACLPLNTYEDIAARGITRRAEASAANLR
jgi:class 3 adenylate cyclase/tetratricopeptide (TPR) repeat protein